MKINQKHTSKGMYEVNRVKVSGSLNKPYYVTQAVILFLVSYTLLGVTMAVQHPSIYTDDVNQAYTINDSDDAMIHADEPSDSAGYTPYTRVKSVNPPIIRDDSFKFCRNGKTIRR